MTSGLLSGGVRVEQAASPSSDRQSCLAGSGLSLERASSECDDVATSAPRGGVGGCRSGSAMRARIGTGGVRVEQAASPSSDRQSCFAGSGLSLERASSESDDVDASAPRGDFGGCRLGSAMRARIGTGGASFARALHRSSSSFGGSWQRGKATSSMASRRSGRLAKHAASPSTTSGGKPTSPGWGAPRGTRPARALHSDRRPVAARSARHRHATGPPRSAA